MIKAVVLNRDNEPVTVLELTREMQGYLRQNRSLKLAVSPPLDFRHPPPSEPPFDVCRIVTLWPLNRELTLLQCDNEADAMALRSAFLPGQQAAVNDTYQRGFGEGALRSIQAMRKILGGGDD